MSMSTPPHSSKRRSTPRYSDDAVADDNRPDGIPLSPSQAAAHHYETQGHHDPIVIERREVVGEVVFDGNGEGRPALEAALQLCAGYLDHTLVGLPASGARLAFNLAGYTFSVAAEATS